MNWTEIIIKISSYDADRVTDILQMASPAGLYIDDYSDFEEEIVRKESYELIDNGLLQKDKTNASVHLYIEPDENPAERLLYIKERLFAEKIIFQIELKVIKEEDWANNWKKYFKPIEIGEKIVIKPTWETYENKSGRIILEIDPSMSFGSGQHESTKLCMELLEKYVDSGTVILDVGTGSGILAVDALLLGAKSAVAIDIDPMSVRVAKENAILNNVQDRICVNQSDLTENIDGKYNLITANIVADIIIKLTDDIDRIMADRCTFIVSGIIDIRENDVIDALKFKNFNITDIKRENGWSAIVCRK